MVQILALALLGYVLGSIPFGKLLGLMRGVDIQKQGSGNIGFANAVRVLGWRIAILVLIGDTAKGYAAVLIASQYLAQTGVLVVGAAALIGHVYPVWLNFRGGKGIATGFGIIALLSPVCAAYVAAVYFAVFTATRTSGISSVAAALTLPGWAILYSPGLTGYFCLLAAFAVYTHRDNIGRLVRTKSGVRRAP